MDYVALSFVREASDILQLRELLGSKQNKIKIIAKIEDQEGVDNLESILNEVDGIMVARGDLGVEVPVYTVPNLHAGLSNAVQNVESESSLPHICSNR